IKKARNIFMLRAFSFQTGLKPVIPHGQQGMPPTQQAAPATQQPRAKAAGELASAASERENFRNVAFIKTSLIGNGFSNRKNSIPGRFPDQAFIQADHNKRSRQGESNRLLLENRMADTGQGRCCRKTGGTHHLIRKAGGITLITAIHGLRPHTARCRGQQDHKQ
ncbi:MAG: hypothetical protein REI12_13290, partial [Pedobacter sp.]|nr:hypothetical protein [Pedobacter sp.]